MHLWGPFTTFSCCNYCCMTDGTWVTTLSSALLLPSAGAIAVYLHYQRICVASFPIKAGEQIKLAMPAKHLVKSIWKRVFSFALISLLQILKGQQIVRAWLSINCWRRSTQACWVGAWSHRRQHAELLLKGQLPEAKVQGRCAIIALCKATAKLFAEFAANQCLSILAVCISKSVLCPSTALCTNHN